MRRERQLKVLIWIVGLAPLAWLAGGLVTGTGLTADPVKYMTHLTGRCIIVALGLTLVITPLRRLTGWQVLGRLRRLVGLFAFAYATIHLAIYFVFDRGLVLAELGEDIAKRPYITVGFGAWLILLVLAATSPRWVLRWMGGTRWNTLHRLVYLVPLLGMVHFAWAQKKSLAPLVPFALLLLAVVGLRLAANYRAGARRPPQFAASAGHIPPES